MYRFEKIRGHAWTKICLCGNLNFGILLILVGKILVENISKILVGY